MFRQICKISLIAMGLSVSVYVCVCICLSVTFVCRRRTLAKIKNVKIDVCRFDICHQMVSLRKLYSANLTYFAKVKSRPSHSDECPYMCCECEYWFDSRPSHSGKYPYKYDKFKYCCTLSSSLAKHTLTHNSKRLVKCDEGEFKCDKGDICSKTNCQLKIV